MARTLKDVFLLYAGKTNPAWGKLSPRSRHLYQQAFLSMERLHDTPVRSITRSMVLDLRDEFFETPGKCRLIMATLNNILGYAHDRDWITSNPAANMKGMPGLGEIEPWSDEEIERAVTLAPPHLAAVLQMALYTGQRRSDLIEMQWKDFDGRSIRVKQTKTKKKLVIPAHFNLRTMLSERKAVLDPKPDDYILTNFYGGKWQDNTLSVAILRHLKALEINRSLHGLRKTAAVKLAEAGCTVHQIASVLGHSSLKMVQHYTKGVEQQKLAEKAMETWNG
jgi:integrase